MERGVGQHDSQIGIPGRHGRGDGANPFAEITAPPQEDDRGFRRGEQPLLQR